MAEGRSAAIHSQFWNVKLGETGLEEAVHVAHFHNHSLQLGVVLNCHLAILSAKAW